MVCTLLAGVNVVAFAADGTSDSVDVMRAYNPNNSEHLYTQDQAEYVANVSRGYQGEGTAWKAPTASSTPIYRIYNPNSGEHLLVGEGETNVPGWQNEGQKMFSDDEMGVPIYRVFNPNSTDAGSHHYTADQGEAASLVALGWQWDNGGAPVLYGVDDGQIVKSAKIIDVSGLQADGTGLVGDILQVTYTAEIGNPQQVTWYKNGSAVYTSTASGGLGLEFTLEVKDNAVLGAGTYEAVITNALGETTKSDSLVVSALPVKAVLSEYGLTEDNQNGVTEKTGTSSITYDAKSAQFVATVTVNKQQYAGAFGLIETEKAMSGKAKASDVVASVKTSTLTATTQKVEDPTKFTDEKALANGTGLYIDNKDGSRTYKWVVKQNQLNPLAPNSTLTRGTSYVLGFAQDGVSDATKPETYAIAGAATAPYVAAPEAIAITKCTDGEKVEVSFVDAEGNKLEWLGGPAGVKQDIGIKNAVFYKNTSNGETGKSILDSTSKDVLKGTLESAQNADKGYSYYWAEITFEEGIYDEGEVTLKSDIQKIATSSADAMNLYENPLSPTDAIVKFTNLATNGTVYVVNASSAPAAAQALKDQATTGDDRITGYAKAERGDANVDVSNCLRSIRDSKMKNHTYYAFFVPENPLEYSMVGTKTTNHTPIDGVPELNPAGFDGLTMVQLPAMYTMNSSVSNVKATTGALTGAAIYVASLNNNGARVDATNAVSNTKNLVKVVDQFGYELTDTNYANYGGTHQLGSWELKQSGSVKTQVAEMDVEIVYENTFTAISVTPLKDDGSAATVDANTTWTAKTAAGQTVTVTAKTDGSWTITIQ